jgi:hypothetical protein
MKQSWIGSIEIRHRTGEPVMARPRRGDVQCCSLTLAEVKECKYKSADEVVWSSLEFGGDFPEERIGRKCR